MSRNSRESKDLLENKQYSWYIPQTSKSVKQSSHNTFICFKIAAFLWTWKVKKLNKFPKFDSFYCFLAELELCIWAMNLHACARITKSHKVALILLKNSKFSLCVPQFKRYRIFFLVFTLRLTVKHTDLAPCWDSKQYLND